MTCRCQARSSLFACLVLAFAALATFGPSPSRCFSPQPLSIRSRQFRGNLALRGRRRSPRRRQDSDSGRRTLDSDPTDRNVNVAPFPTLPSELFLKMAQSQLELLAHSITRKGSDGKTTKIESMALYLPQENSATGQLEFTPVAIYPDPSNTRVFIASDNNAQSIFLPRTLTALPGFETAHALLPGYPMISADDSSPNVGVVEEVMCNPRSPNKAAALSVPLLSGPRTVGVLLVSPIANYRPTNSTESFWTEADCKKVSVAAQSLSIALSMDNERVALENENQQFRRSLSDSLHQVKNPIQALRTYSKLLQRSLSTEGSFGATRGTLSSMPQLLSLTDNLLEQSDRVVDLLVPMDSLAKSSETGRIPRQYLIGPAAPKSRVSSSLVVRGQKDEDFQQFERASGLNSSTGGRQESSVIQFGAPSQTRDSYFETPGEILEFGSPASSSASQVSASDARHESFTATDAPLLGNMDVEMIFVSDVLRPVFSAFEAMALETGVQFEVIEASDELPGVLASPRGLQEAVSNVLDNAFKYVNLPKADSPFTRNENPIVRVTMSPNATPLEPGVSIIFEDNGPGIPEDECESVFSRGFRGRRTQNVGGSGIGLDIAQLVMRKMGGALRVVKNGKLPESLDGAIMQMILYRNPRLF